MQSSVELIDGRDTYGRVSKTTQLRFTLSGAPNGVPAPVMMGSLQNMLLVFLEAYGIPRARVFVQDGLAIITIKGTVNDPTELRRVIEEGDRPHPAEDGQQLHLLQAVPGGDRRPGGGSATLFVADGRAR